VKKKFVRGFTLVEMIVVIAITGIIAAAVAAFLVRPVQGYADSARRAELTDLADTALRRVTRDVRSALPNSVRVTTNGGVNYLEYLQTSGGGRYRQDLDSGGLGNTLDFTVSGGDSSFEVFGTAPTCASGEFVVVYNLNSNSAITTSNAYSGDNRATCLSSTATTITLTAAKHFPFASPGKRFHVVQYPVTYACSPASGQLRRYSGYTIQTAQPNDIAAVPLSTAPVNALLAQNVAGCSFSYSEVNQRTGVLILFLQLTSGGESMQLFQQVHVNNVP